MTSQCSRLREVLQRRQGRREQLSEDLGTAQEKEKALSNDVVQWEKVQSILRLVAQKTQQELEWHITKIVSFALRDVFPEPYELRVEFCERRNKTEADIYFTRSGDSERFDPLSSAGGGAIDIASLALRISLWNLTHPGKRNVLIPDEPLKNLSKDLQPKAGAMLEQISEKLGLQIIMVTHETSLTQSGKIFKVTYEKGLSTVVEDEEDKK